MCQFSSGPNILCMHQEMMMNTMGAKTSSHAGVASLSHEAQWSILRKDQSACKADLIFSSIQDIVEPSHFADERTLFLLFVDVI